MNNPKMCPTCKTDIYSSDVFIDIEFERNKYIHAICCKCGQVIKDEKEKTLFSVQEKDKA